MDFEDTKWFDTLVFYGFKLTETIAKEDDDVRLLPSIVEKVVLPKLSGMVPVLFTESLFMCKTLSRKSFTAPCV